MAVLEKGWVVEGGGGFGKGEGRWKVGVEEEVGGGSGGAGKRRFVMEEISGGGSGWWRG